MKAMIKLLTIMAMALALASCGSDNELDVNDTTDDGRFRNQSNSNGINAQTFINKRMRNYSDNSRGSLNDNLFLYSNSAGLFFERTGDRGWSSSYAYGTWRTQGDSIVLRERSGFIYGNLSQTKLNGRTCLRLTQTNNGRFGGYYNPYDNRFGITTFCLDSTDF